MKKIIFILAIFTLLAATGAGCVEIKKIDEESAVAVPSNEVKAPTPEEIGEVDVFEEEAEETSEIDSLVQEIENIENEADDLFDDFKAIDVNLDNKLNL